MDLMRTLYFMVAGNQDPQTSANFITDTEVDEELALEDKLIANNQGIFPEEALLLETNKVSTAVEKHKKQTL